MLVSFISLEHIGNIQYYLMGLFTSILCLFSLDYVSLSFHLKVNKTTEKSIVQYDAIAQKSGSHIMVVNRVLLC